MVFRPLGVDVGGGSSSTPGPSSTSLILPSVRETSQKSMKMPHGFVFDTTIGDKKMTYLTCTPDELFVGNCMCFRVQKRISGAINIKAPDKITLPKSFLN